MKVLYQADNGLRKVTAGRFAGNRRAHNPHELDGVPDPEVLAFAAFRQRIEHKSDSDFRACQSGNNHVNDPIPLWHTHSCMPRRRSGRRMGCSVQKTRRDESRRCTQECVRHKKQARALCTELTALFSAELRRGRSDQGSSPWSTQPRSLSRTSLSNRHMHRLPRRPGAES
jgi:hypothetical protein